MFHGAPGVGASVIVSLVRRLLSGTCCCSGETHPTSPRRVRGGSRQTSLRQYRRIIQSFRFFVSTGACSRELLLNSANSTALQRLLIGCCSGQGRNSIFTASGRRKALYNRCPACVFCPLQHQTHFKRLARSNFRTARTCSGLCDRLPTPCVCCTGCLSRGLACAIAALPLQLAPSAWWPPTAGSRRTRSAAAASSPSQSTIARGSTRATRAAAWTCGTTRRKMHFPVARHKGRPGTPARPSAAGQTHRQPTAARSWTRRKGPAPRRRPAPSRRRGCRCETSRRCSPARCVCCCAAAHMH